MIFMGIVGNLEKLLNDAREYAERSVDNYKLTFVEDVSTVIASYSPLSDLAERTVATPLTVTVAALALYHAT